MSAYDGPSIFDRKHKRSEDQDHVKSDVNFTLDYEKSLPEGTPSHQSIMDDAKKIEDSDREILETSRSNFKRPQSEENRSVLNQFSPADEKITEQRDCSAQSSNFKPTEIPSIYKHKKFVSATERADAEKEWYEMMKSALSKKTTEYILPESSVRKLMARDKAKTTKLGNKPTSTSKYTASRASKNNLSYRSSDRYGKKSKNSARKMEENE